MAINVNPVDFRGFGLGSPGTPQLPNVGALGLQAAQLRMNQQEAQRQAALEQAKMRQMSEIALGQNRLERDKMSMQNQQFGLGLAATQSNNAQQLAADRQKAFMDAQYKDRDFALNAGKFGVQQAELMRKAQKDQQDAAHKQMAMNIKQLAGLKKEKLNERGAIAVSAKLAMDQVTDPQQAELLRNETIKEFISEGHISKEYGEQLRKLPIPAYKRALDVAILETNKASEYKAMREEKGGSGSETIIQSDGTIIHRNTPNKPTEAKVEKDIIAGQAALKELKNISNLYSKEYLTYRGKAGARLISEAEKFEGVPGLEQLSQGAANLVTGKTKEEQGKFLGDRTKFNNSVDQYFQLKYRGPVTGAAAAIKELGPLKKSFLSGEMSPSELIASIDLIANRTSNEVEANKAILNEGINTTPTTKRPLSELSKEEYEALKRSTR